MTQVETLMRQMEAKINLLQESITAKDTDIAQLKAEIKRLREGIQKEIGIQTELRNTGINTGQVFDSVLKVRRCVVDALESLLSPAPVTEGREENGKMLSNIMGEVWWFAKKAWNLAIDGDYPRFDDWQNKFADSVENHVREAVFISPKNEDQK